MLFMKESSCSHKLRYEGYMELICGYLSNDIYTDPHEDFLYRDHLCLWKDSHVNL
jgi:hypothetical protein